MSRLLIVSAILMIALIAMGTINIMTVQSSPEFLPPASKPGKFALELDNIRRAAPIAIVGDNIYIVWPTNRTGNDEVNFRASTDSGATFGDKINLSNSTNADSQDVEIAADGDNIVITWWERNATNEEPVARISSDAGATFGSLLRLATNGTIG